MRPAAIRLVGNSSRYSLSWRSLIRAVRNYAEQTRANFIVTTEVANNERSNALGRLLGFGLVHFEDGRKGEDETAIQFRRRWWRKVSAEADPLSRKGIAARSGSLVFSVDALFRNRRTGQTVLICAVHLPRFWEEKAAWLECIERLEHKWDAWQRDPEIDCVVIVGDWNYDLRDEGNRDEMRESFPGCQLTWSRSKNRLPTSGTHGKRLIDYAIVHGGTITRAELLADDASSDHRPWFMRVQLPEVKP